MNKPSFSKLCAMVGLMLLTSPLGVYGQTSQTTQTLGQRQAVTQSNRSLVESMLEEEADETENQPPKPEDIENSINHSPIFPSSYPENYGEMNKDLKSKKPHRVESLNFPEKGTQLGHPANSLIVNGWVFDYTDLQGNTGANEDFDELMNVLDQNLAAYVGQNGIHTFFGHYYNLSDNGVFNPLYDQDLLDVGSEVIITDKDGYSKVYEITQVIDFLHPDQELHFYDDTWLPYLAYHGNGDDMVYIQYCRWDISLGLLICNFGYRVH